MIVLTTLIVNCHYLYH